MTEISIETLNQLTQQAERAANLGAACLGIAVLIAMTYLIRKGMVSHIHPDPHYKNNFKH